MGIKNFCIYCGKKFETNDLHILFCSDKCRIARKKECKKISNLNYRQKIRAKLARIKTLENELETANKEIARLQKAIKNASQFTNMQYCERMKLKASTLPCGKREECWLNPKCENNMLNEKPVFK